MNIYPCENSVLLLENVTDEEKEKIFDLVGAKIKTDKNILPRPLIYERNSFNPKFNGKKFSFYSPNAFQLRLMQEIIQMASVFNLTKAGAPEYYYDTVADCLADIITLCITELEVIGYDENKRSELFLKTNARKEKLGCFMKKDSAN